MNTKNTITDAQLRALSVRADRCGDERAWALISAAGRGDKRARQAVADLVARANARKARS